MKIKQLKEKTAQGLKDFLPKIGVNDIEGLIDVLNDKLSKSRGGEVKKPIVITNDNSNYSIIINPDGAIYVWRKDIKNNIFKMAYNPVSGLDRFEIGIRAMDGGKKIVIENNIKIVINFFFIKFLKNQFIFSNLSS